MKMPEQRIRKGLSIFKAKVSDGLNDFMVVIYNNYYGFKALQIGCEYLFYGKVTGNLLRREISSPRIVKADSSLLFRFIISRRGLPRRQYCRICARL